MMRGISGGMRRCPPPGMNELLIGVTFCAFGTSLPELAIALGAVFRRQADVTLGESYASNILMGLAVAGLLALARPCRWKR